MSSDSEYPSDSDVDDYDYEDYIYGDNVEQEPARVNKELSKFYCLRF